MSEYRYEGFTHTPCRRCLQLGIWVDRAIQPIVGLTGEGDDILLCGHTQDAGDRAAQPRVTISNVLE